MILMPKRVWGTPPHPAAMNRGLAVEPKLAGFQQGHSFVPKSGMHHHDLEYGGYHQGHKRNLLGRLV